MYMYKHYFETSALKPLGQSKPMGRGNKSIYTGSRSHYQDGRHVYIMVKAFIYLLLQNQTSADLETRQGVFGAQYLQTL